MDSKSYKDQIEIGMKIYGEKEKAILYADGNVIVSLNTKKQAVKEYFGIKSINSGGPVRFNDTPKGKKSKIKFEELVRSGYSEISALETLISQGYGREFSTDYHI